MLSQTRFTTQESYVEGLVVKGVIQYSLLQPGRTLRNPSVLKNVSRGGTLQLLHLLETFAQRVHDQTSSLNLGLSMLHHFFSFVSVYDINGRPSCILSMQYAFFLTQQECYGEGGSGFVCLMFQQNLRPREICAHRFAKN